MILSVNSFDFFLFLHFSLTFFMTGLIWLIQLIHYPTFSFIEKKQYKQFQNFHMNRIFYLVAPIMILELFSGAYFFFFYFSESIFFSINFILNILIWMITLIVFVRIHRKLLDGFKASLYKKLILSNWSRTFLWTSKCIFIFIYKVEIMK